MSVSSLSCLNVVRDVPHIHTHCQRLYSARSSPTRRWIRGDSIQKLNFNYFGDRRLLPGCSYTVLRSRRRDKVTIQAASGGDLSADFVDEAEKEARRTSTLPERFRHLTKEVPGVPVRWPWLIAVVFLVYAWRAVLWELSNWKKLVLAIPGVLWYLLQFPLALIFHFAGDLITGLIWQIETVLYTLRSIYFSIVAATPIQELTTIILLTSAILAIAETVTPGSVNRQPYLLTFAGLVGLGAVQGFLSDVTFWPLVISMFCFSRYVKKRDVVSAALPVAALLVAIGQPWLQGFVILLYTALAIHRHRTLGGSKNLTEARPTARGRPIPLVLAGLAIGIHVAAKWIRYRHLTWMIA